MIKTIRVLVLLVLSALLSTPLLATDASPAFPLGLKGVLDPLGRAFTIIWEPVSETADGTPLSSGVTYNVYRRTTPRGEPVRVNTFGCPITVFADRTDGQVFYYSVRAVDSDGHESADSYLVDSSREANLVVLSDDGVSSITIPGEDADVLRPSHNSYGVPLLVRLIDETVRPGGESVRNVRLQLVRSDNNLPVSDVGFESSGLQLRIGYNSVSGQLALGAPGPVSASAAPTVSASPEQLTLFWFNGADWIKIGGSVNETTKTIEARSAHVGSYQLRVTASAAGSTLARASVYPSLFTPNGDGLNDRVFIVLDNPTSAVVRGEIFEISGRWVASLPAATLNAGTSTLIWTGVDDRGSLVRSGLYVYRVEGDGQVITGTVAVAR